MSGDKVHNTGMRAWGKKMTKTQLDEIRPFLERYHTDPPEIVNAFYGDNYYTIYIREGEKIFQETYRFFDEEFTRIFVGQINRKTFELKQILNFIPSVIFLIIGASLASQNIYILIGCIFVSGLFLFKATQKQDLSTK